MKYLVVALLPSAAMAQSSLFSLGSSCPTIHVSARTIQWDRTGTLLAVVHKPGFELVNEHENAPAHVVEFLQAGHEADAELTAEIFGVEQGGVVDDRVCGDEGRGYVRISSSDVAYTANTPLEYSFTLSPEGCDCGDMRISMLVGLDKCSNGEICGGIYLNSHELESLTEPSWIRPRAFTTLGSAWDHVITGFENVDDFFTDFMDVKFSPTTSTSTNFISLWALLMHGWW